MTRAEQFVNQVKNYDNEIAGKVAALQKLVDSRPVTNVGCYDFGIDDEGRPTIQHQQVSGAPTSFHPPVLQDWLDHWFGNYKEESEATP